jgi:hypothetical protein
MAYGNDDMKPKPKGEAISETTLSTIIAQQIELAKHHDKHARRDTRDKALDYYMGEMDKYVPPEPNRSRVVSRDVADTIGWMLPGIMRVFTASDRMAIAEPEEEVDAEFADEATDGMNYVFWKDNKGYEVVYNATWDALLMGNGIVKTYYDDEPVYKVSFHSGLTVDQAALLLQDESTEVLAQEVTQETLIDPVSQQPVVVDLYELKIKRKVLDGKFVVDVIPPEEFLISDEAICTDEAAFTDHWQQKTRSELVAMGYDKDDVYEIPTAGRPDTPEEIARRLYIDDESTDASMERVDYHECFIRVDVDGDGEAELVRACYAGNQNGKLLDWEVWEDEHPFDDIPCEPIPHRWDARSIADETMDIQDIKTVISRQYLNNLYWVNNPQQAVFGDVKNPESLTDPQFGQPVMMKAGGQVVPLERPYIGDKALMGLTHFDEVRQSRTGVGRQSMALDPEALQNQTATAAQNNRDASYSQVELVARNMAEWGWSKVFRKLMRLMIKHQKQPRKLMLGDKKQITIDPRFWNADMKVTINTGLGTGSRDRDLAMLGNVMSSQLMLADRFVSLGAMEDAIDMLPKILMTMEKMAEAAGIRNPDDFYPEYTEEKVAQLKQMAAERAQQPPPEVALEQMKQQGAQQLKAVDAQISMQQAETKAQGDIVKNKAELEADMMTAEAERQNALILAQQKMEHDFRLQQEQIASNERIKAAELKQQRELELLKLNMTDVQAGEDGEPKPVDATTAMLMDGLGRLGEGVSRLGEMFAGMQAMMNAPTEIVRGPDGKAMGTRKVVN